MNASSQTLQPVPLWARQSARERNEVSYRTTCSYQGLPESSHIAVQATPDAVLVTSTDISVLAEWLYVMGGRVTTVQLPSGQTTYTLATTTWTDSPKSPPVRVFVTVVQASDEPVMWEITEATRTAREAVAS